MADERPADALAALAALPSRPVDGGDSEHVCVDGASLVVDVHIGWSRRRTVLTVVLLAALAALAFLLGGGGSARNPITWVHDGGGASPTTSSSSSSRVSDRSNSPASVSTSFASDALVTHASPLSPSHTSLVGGSASASQVSIDTRLALSSFSATALEIKWFWAYVGNSSDGARTISAAGTLITTGDADANGFYRITAIAGQRNGVPITALFPSGRAIPGNEPYAVDNLVRLAQPRVGRVDQLTIDGIGMQLADGSYASPFWNAMLSPPAYREPFQAPLAPGQPPPTGLTSELPVVFSAFPLSRVDQTVTLIRHAERPRDPFKSGFEELSTQGHQRAACLAVHFAAAPAADVVQCVFASAAAAARGPTRRALETATPVARALAVHVRAEFDSGDTNELTDAIKASSCPHALVVWEADEMPLIMAKLGVAHVRDYPVERYDVVYTIRGGRVTESSQPAECSFV